MKSLLVIIAILAVVSCRLTVLNSGGDKTTAQITKPIEYSIANFGLIPYGVRSTAPLRIANPTNGCDTIDLYGRPQNPDNEDDQIEGGENNSDQDDFPKQDLPFVLIERGECSFTQKAMNAAAAGAKMAIIMDNILGEDVQNIVMGDDGFGDNVNIPTIFISQNDGDLLNELVKEREQLGLVTTLVIEFDVQKSERVDLKFFINPPGRSNFELMNTFFENFKVLKNKVDFSPIYEFYPCPGCNDTVNCIRGGRYCALDMDGTNAGTGGEVADEYLLQICIAKTLGVEKWWNYSNQFHQHCHQIPNYKSCGRQKLLTQAEQTTVQNCMYPIGSSQQTDEEIPVLEEQLRIKELSGVYFFPSVTINNVLYRGSIFGEDVLEAVCATLEKPSSGCKKLINKTAATIEHKNVNEGPNVAIIIMVVSGVLILFFFFMIFIYRRMVTKDINKEMNAEVNQMVSQYIAFYESKDSSRVENKNDSMA